MKNIKPIHEDLEIREVKENETGANSSVGKLSSWHEKLLNKYAWYRTYHDKKWSDNVNVGVAILFTLLLSTFSVYSFLTFAYKGNTKGNPRNYTSSTPAISYVSPSNTQAFTITSGSTTATVSGLTVKATDSTGVTVSMRVVYRKSGETVWKHFGCLADTSSPSGTGTTSQPSYDCVTAKSHGVSSLGWNDQNKDGAPDLVASGSTYAFPGPSTSLSLSAGTYEWSAQAYNSRGVYSSWGAIRTFTVAPAIVETVTTPGTFFSDEFNAGPLNTTTWKTVLPWGSTHNDATELQNYDPLDLIFVNSGIRIMTENRVNRIGYPYSSGIINTQKQYSYGYYEMKAKLPKGKGIWPAFWLTNDGDLEVDAMEMLGDNPNKVYMTLHHKDTPTGIKHQHGFEYTGPDFSAGYHTFGVDWQPTYVRWYIDGVQRAEILTSVSAGPLNILANTAVGSATSWPGLVDSAAIASMPLYYDIDYIRAYSSKP